MSNDRHNAPSVAPMAGITADTAPRLAPSAVMYWDGGERAITPREKILIEEHGPSSFGIPLAPATLPDPTINVEAMLVACVPGGSVVDPQLVADNLRAWFTETGKPACHQGVDGMAPFLNDVVTAASLLRTGHQSKPLADRISNEAFRLLAFAATDKQGYDDGTGRNRDWSIGAGPAEQQRVDMADADTVALEIARRFIPVDSPGAHNEGQQRAALQVDIVGAINTAFAARQPEAQTFQAGVSEWMGKCFLPSLYSNMTERGDRLLEEVLELLQAHGYDHGRVATLVNYVFNRPVGEPAQEVGGVMVTLAGYCWVAGLDMHAAGDAELQRIKQPEVMDKIRRKQEAKNALHFDTPLPGDATANVEVWPREGDLVRYGDGSSALAIRLGPHAGGWHGYQCCGGYTFFTKAYRPSRADMDTWLDCAKYRDERTKVADSRVAHEMYLIDGQAVQS